MRAVICYDIEIDGGLSDAAKFEMLLKDYSKDFEQYVKKNNPDLAKIVNFTQEQAEVPMQERRGSTGSLGDIVFRGSRATKVNVLDLLQFIILSHDPQTVIMKSINTGDEYSFPFDSMSKSLKVRFDKSDMTGKKVRFQEKHFQAFATKIRKESKSA